MRSMSLEIHALLSLTSSMFQYLVMTEFSGYSSISVASCSPITWFFSSASIKSRIFLPKEKEPELFLFCLQHVYFSEWSGTFHLVFLHLTRHSPHLFSRLTWILWQRAGPNSTKHMISLFRRHTWAVYELFWTRNPHYLVIWFNEKIVEPQAWLNPCFRFLDTFITGCAEHAHQLNQTD